MNIQDDFVYNSESHECVLRCPDTYSGLPHKIKAGLLFVYKQFNPSFVVKIDDDVVVNVPKLIEYAETTKDHYTGNVTYNYNPNDGMSSIYCGGPMYYLSSNAVSCLQDMDSTVFSSEDACVGKHLIEKRGIPAHNIQLYTSTFDQKDNYIAYHDAERLVFSVKAPTHAISMPSPAYKLSFMRLMSQKNNFNTSHLA